MMRELYTITIRTKKKYDPNKYLKNILELLWYNVLNFSYTRMTGIKY